MVSVARPAQPMTSGRAAQAIANALPRRSFMSLLKNPIIYTPLPAAER
jgi:hypothetical protein